MGIHRALLGAPTCWCSPVSKPALHWLTLVKESPGLDYLGAIHAGGGLILWLLPFRLADGSKLPSAN